MIHAHISLWIVGSPRFDKTNVPRQLSSGVIEVEPDTEDVRVHSSEEAAKLMACFWDRVLTEWNVEDPVFSEFRGRLRRSGGTQGSGQSLGALRLGAGRSRDFFRSRLSRSQVACRWYDR